MTFASHLWHYLWFAQGVLAPALFMLLIRRRMFHEFPAFVAYVGLVAVQTGTLLVLNYTPAFSGHDYVVAYVGTTIGTTALSFGVIYELLRHMLRNYPTLASLGLKVFCWGTILLIVVAITLAWLAPASGADSTMSTVFVFRRSLDLLLCGLLALLFIIPRYFNLSWRSYTFGIALGLGIVASVELATHALSAQTAPIARNLSTDLLNVATQGSSVCAALVWIVYLFVREQTPSKKIIRKLPDHDLQNWNQELQRLLHP